MSSKNKRVSKNFVQYYCLIESKGTHYKLGKIIINRFQGDIYFIPAFEAYLTLNDGDESQRRKVKKLSFHKSGEFHFEVEAGEGNHRLSKLTHIITEIGEGFSYQNSSTELDEVRTMISKVKFQKILTIFVKDVYQLPIFMKTVQNIDVVYDSSTIMKDLKFSFSIISGKLMLSSINGIVIHKDVNIHTRSSLKVINRALGHESGNGDKMMQYSFDSIENCPDFTGNTLLRVYGDSDINKLLNN